jgi:oligopeptide transport system substrate-binding protein
MSFRLRLSALLIGVALLLLAASCRRPPSPEAVLHRGLTGDPATLDPQRTSETYSEEVLRDLYEGLSAETVDGQVGPGAASDWSLDASGRHYRFTLRSGSKWSNGDPLVAEDFAAGLRRAVDPKTASPHADFLELIEHAPAIVRGQEPPEHLAVRAVDPQHLEIDLSEPAPYFAGLLATAVAYPVHRPSLAKYGDAFSRAGRLVGNGAYRLVATVPGVSVRLEQNPNYWDAAHVAVPAVEYLSVADVSAQLTRYRAGSLDLMDTLPNAQVEWARENLPGELQLAPQLTTVYLAFNHLDGPLAKRPELGEALALALDRESLTGRALRGGQVPAYAFVPPGIAGYARQSYAWAERPLAERQATARDRLQAAGFVAGKPLKLRVLYNHNEAIHNLTVALAAEWQEALPVEVEFVELEFQAFMAARRDRAHWDVVVAGWNADYADPGNFLGVFRSASEANDPGLRDAPYDGLLDQAAREADPAHRLELLAQAERRLLDLNVMTPLYYAVSRRLVKPYVEGAVLNPMNHNYSKFLVLRPHGA